MVQWFYEKKSPSELVLAWPYPTKSEHESLLGKTIFRAHVRTCACTHTHTHRHTHTHTHTHTQTNTNSTHCFLRCLHGILCPPRLGSHTAYALLTLQKQRHDAYAL